MALKLTLDGKEIGAIDGDKVLSSNDLVTKRETMEVPLGPPEPIKRFSDIGPDTDDLEPDEPEGEPDEAEEGDEEEEGSSAELKLLKKQNELLMRQLETNNKLLSDLNNKRQAETTDNLDSIPDDIPPDKDPFGIAKTLKNITKALSQTQAKVDRLDQHTGYREAMTQLENEKGNYPVFKDKRLGKMAEKLLNAELATNKVDPLPVIVSKVASDVSGIAKFATKEYVKTKTEMKGKVPQSIRSKDGTSPAVVVNKPKNVAEAGAAYQAWRRSRARFNQEGR